MSIAKHHQLCILNPTSQCNRLTANHSHLLLYSSECSDGMSKQSVDFLVYR
jgi:hypothetical protein